MDAIPAKVRISVQHHHFTFLNAVWHRCRDNSGASTNIKDRHDTPHIMVHNPAIPEFAMAGDSVHRASGAAIRDRDLRLYHLDTGLDEGGLRSVTADHGQYL